MDHEVWSADSFGEIRDENGLRIAQVYSGSDDLALILAAPAMLAALKALIEGDNGFGHARPEDWDAARAAIDRAEGR